MRSAALPVLLGLLVVRRARGGLTHDLPSANPWPIREMSGAFFWRKARHRLLVFHDDGACEFCDGETGTWQNTADAISIETTAPLRDGVDERLRYHCMLHRNNWGDRPRLLKGVKSRDRRPPIPPSLLRPVLASFSSTGARPRRRAAAAVAPPPPGE